MAALGWQGSRPQSKANPGDHLPPSATHARCGVLGKVLRLGGQRDGISGLRSPGAWAHSAVH